MNYYENAINRTSKKHTPWYIILADDKEMSRYIVAKIIWKKNVKLTYIKEPELDSKVKANIEFYKKQLKA